MEEGQTKQRYTRLKWLQTVLRNPAFWKKNYNLESIMNDLCVIMYLKNKFNLLIMFLTCGTIFLKLSMILELLASCQHDSKNNDLVKLQ